MKTLFATFLLVAACAVEAGTKLRWNRLAPIPDTNGVAGAFAGISGGALIVAGGANFPDAKPWDGGKKMWHDDIFVLAQSDGAWRKAGQLPRALGYGVSVTHRDEVICVGGSDEKQHHKDVFALKWNGRSISTRTLPSLPREVANACGANVDDTLYVAGGLETPNGTNALLTFFALKLNDRGARWQQLPTWPGAPRMLATAAAHDGNFFLVGGVELHAGENGKPSRRYLRDGYRFDVARGWRRIAALPFTAAAAPSPAPVVQNQIFLLSYDDGSRAALAPSPSHPGFSGSVITYDTKHDAWTIAGIAAAAHVTLPAVQWKSRWILPSGEVRPGVRSPDVWSVSIEAE